MLTFIDETGADRQNLIRKHGYSIRGKPARIHKLLHRCQHISVIVAISAQGMLDCKIHLESVNGEVFYKFVLSHLVPHLQPFEGYNKHTVEPPLSGPLLSEYLHCPDSPNQLSGL